MPEPIVTTSRRDPLLSAARLVLILSRILVGVIGVAMVVAIPVLLFNQTAVLVALDPQGRQPSPSGTIAGLMAIAVIVAAMAVLGIRFFRHLRRMIDSVGYGDPFDPVNAERLARMGWLVLAIGLVSSVVRVIGGLLGGTVRQATAEFGFSLGGILLVLVLFVLARVFRRGAEMRDELEGTV